MSSFFCGGIMMAEGAMLQLEGSVKYMLWGGIGFYVVLVLLIGYLSGRKVKNVQDFLVAGRRLPMWMATATLLATWFGAGSSMGVAATVYSGGIRDVLADPFGASVSLILAGIFLVGILRKMNHMTVTDVIQSRFGAGPAIYASFWMIPVYVGWLGSQVLGLGVILNLLTGVDLLTAQLIGAAVVLIYTATGGMWAVTLTDVVQVALADLPDDLFRGADRGRTRSHRAGRHIRGGRLLRRLPESRRGLLAAPGGGPEKLLLGDRQLHGQLDHHGAWLYRGTGPDAAFPFQQR